MDRIRKALDLAREERARPYHAGLEDSSASDLKPAEERPFQQLPAAIEYTKTKSFAPSPDLLETNRILSQHDSSNAAAAFRMLRTQVLQRMEEHDWRSLAVLSPGQDDGKTTTAINLAVSLASDERHTVLLVDLDLKRPGIAGMLGITPESGVDDVIRGKARVENCLYHPEDFDRLVVLPARAAMGNSSEALAGPRCRELVAELRGRYPDRLLVFDLPPILGADDALAFVPLVECGLMVVAEGATKRDDLLRCMELLRRMPIVGTVLNRATNVASAYG